MDPVKIVTRQADGLDKHFILSAWLKGQRYGNLAFEVMSPEPYYELFSKYIGQLLISPHVECTIACGENDPTWIVGFAVTQGPGIHWIFVKTDYRKKGIARLMLKNKPISTVYSITKVGYAIALAKSLSVNLKEIRNVSRIIEDARP